MDSDSEYVESGEEGHASISEPELPFVPPSSPPVRPTVLPHPSHAPINSLSSANNSNNIIIPALKIDEFAQGEDAKTYFSRPNRFFGPASTWKSWTEEERHVALSLDRVRAEDLGLHLVSAFTLKRKRKPQSQKSKGKERARTESEHGESSQDELDRNSFLPKIWTAWPLPADQVPRADLLPPTENENSYRAEVDPRPSATLEDCLVATASRLARQRWEAREWEPLDDTRNQLDVKPLGPNLDPNDDEEIFDTADEEQEDPINDDDDSDQESSTDESYDPDHPTFSSQALDRLPRTDESMSDIPSGIKLESQNRPGTPKEVDAPRPVPLADIDQAHRLFLPSARHILTKLDDLLLGLHTQRHAYASKPTGKPRGRSLSTGGLSSVSGSTNAVSRSPSRGRNPSRSSTRRGRKAAESNVSDVSTSKTQQQADRRTRTLGLRDWSDVMGLAALTGWDAEVVQRASERCAALFGENMLFRTFHEGSQKHTGDGINQDSKQGSYFTQHLALESDSSDHQSEDEDPHQDSDEAIKPSTETDDRCCPYETCPRHVMPFRKQYHLRRHLDNVHSSTHGHGSSPLPRSSTRPSTRSRSKSIARPSRPRSASTAAGVYSVDNQGQSWENQARASRYELEYDMDLDISSFQDPIVCPISTCSRHHRPFSTGTKMYSHVRRIHPDVDIDEVKMMELRRRGERRGRGKKSRNVTGRKDRDEGRASSISAAERHASTPRQRRRRARDDVVSVSD